MCDSSGSLRWRWQNQTQDRCIQRRRALFKRSNNSGPVLALANARMSETLSVLTLLGGARAQVTSTESKFVCACMYLQKCMYVYIIYT